MNANVTALVVAVVGVAGTLFAALLTQRSYIRTKKLELQEQRDQRDEQRRQAGLKDRRESYVALNAAARVYRRALKDRLYEHDKSSEDLERARREFDLRISEEQLIGHNAVVDAAHLVSARLADAFGRVRRYEAGLTSPDDISDAERAALIDDLDGPVAQEIRHLRTVMRRDLGVLDDYRRVPVFVDTVAWVRLENRKILCTRSRGKDVFYVPGGKREGQESDRQTLLREIVEELTVALLPGTVRFVGTYQADQSPGEPDGAVVRMSCYSGDYEGTLAASSEIEELAWFTFSDRHRVAPVDQLLFDDLKASGELR